MRKTLPQLRGYTLIELIVSVAIFAIIATAVAGAFLNLIAIDRQARSLDDLVNDLSFALDSMSRNIRTGTDYCGADTQGCSSTQFSFTDTNGCITTYTFSGSAIVETVEAGGSCTAENAPITGAATVTNLTFYLTNPLNDEGLTPPVAVPAEGAQPLVTFTTSGTLQASANNSVSFTIETSDAQRQINI